MRSKAKVTRCTAERYSLYLSCFYIMVVVFCEEALFSLYKVLRAIIVKINLVQLSIDCHSLYHAIPSRCEYKHNYQTKIHHQSSIFSLFGIPFDIPYGSHYHQKPRI